MKLFIITILIAITNGVWAVESTPTYDLKTLLQLAKEKNPAIVVYKEKANQVLAQQKIIKSTLYPNLIWTLDGTYQKDAVYTGSPKFGGNPYNQYSSDLKLIQMLYAYGALSAIYQYDYDKKVQDLNYEIQERQLTHNIIEAYSRFILNQHALENLLKTKEIIQKSLQTANDRYRSGRGQLLDVLQVKTQLEMITPQLEQARNQIENSANQLAYYMGEKERPGFKIRGELKTIALKEIQQQVDIKKFHYPEYEVNQAQLQSLEYAKDVTVGKNYPTLKLIGDYQYKNYKKSELFSDYSNSWAIQLQLTIPLFSGFSSQYEKQSLVSQEVQLKKTRHDIENSLTLNQENSLKNLQTIENSLASAEKASELAEASLKEAHRNYRLATIDFLQFLSVEQASLQTKTTLDQLKYQNIVALSNYLSVSGQSLEILVDMLSAGGKI